MKKRRGSLVLIVVLALTVPLALGLGDPVGPTWPPPGGADWAGSGISPGHTGGLDWQYSNFDFVGGGLAELWWGTVAGSTGISLDNGGNYTGAEILTFSAALSTSTQAVWTGQSYLTWLHQTSGWQTDTIDVRLTITLSGGATWIDPGPTGVTGHDGTIAVITGDYVANILAEGYMPSNPSGAFAWQPINVGFDSVNTAGSTGTSFNAGFWYELLPVVGDLDGDYDVDLDDYVLFVDCMKGPVEAYPTKGCADADFYDDGHVDLRDFAEFKDMFTIPG
ncbi:MAG: hypothetical protein ACYTFA_13125 [Planctomycetota bacterium]